MSVSRLQNAIVRGSRQAEMVIGSLRDVQIVSSKPVLPAEIFSMVLDYLAVLDLIHCARVSKRMREMVYDDTRWVRKLRLMGCWNEVAARATTDQASLAQTEDHLNATGYSSEKLEATREPTDQQRISTVMLSDFSESITAEILDEASSPSPVPEADGFDQAPLSSLNSDMPPPTDYKDISAFLVVMKNVRSVRGFARQEYGRVYSVLRPFYKDAVRAKHPSGARIFRAYRDPNQQARMLSQVLRFAASDCSQGQIAREQKLGAMAKAFEDAVLHEFEQGLRFGDVDGRMKKYANVLVTLNGGERAISKFIAENPLLKSPNDLGNPMDCLSPTHAELFFVDELHCFFRNLTSGANDQIKIIQRAFPPLVDVATPFLDDIGRKICVPYINTLLDCARQKSTESYLRAISSTYQQYLLLLENLQLPHQFAGSCTEGLSSISSLIFSAHMEAYLIEELEYFKRRSNAEVDGWERQLSQQDASIESLYMANVNRQADKRDFLSSFRKVVMMPVNAFPTFPFGAKSVVNAKTLGDPESLEPPQPSTSMPVSKQAFRPRSVSSIDDLGNVPLRPSSPLMDAPTTELAARAAIMKSRLEGIRSLFSLEVALNLVHMAKASIDRTAVFAHARGRFEEDARGQCESIFVMLLKTLGKRHVRFGFDQAVEHLANYSPRVSTGRSHGVAPLVVFLELVNVGDLIQQMLDVFYEQELANTGLIDRNDFLSPSLKEKKRFEQMLDERVAAGLNKGIEVLIAEVEFICASTQTPEDYNPGSTGVDINQVSDISPSNTAIWVVDLVSSHSKMLIGSTDKNMLDVFNQEVGLRLYTILCKHLKRQRISVAGATRLISDMNHYFTFIQTLKNKELLQYFKALRELSQIYLIGPTDAKELATVIADTDRYLGIIRPDEVYEFAERRADWYQVKSRVEKAMYGIGCHIM